MTRDGRLRTWFRRVLGTAAVVLLVGSWLAMMRAARRAVFFEPTTEALARAAAARPEGIGWALVLVVTAVVLALATRRTRLVLLAVPGLVVASTLALAPRADALLTGLVATAVVVLVVVAAEVAGRGRRRQARSAGGGPHSSG